MHELSFGFSPCPNDTFAFHALVHGLVGTGLRVRPTLRDIEELNRAARTGELELSKISVGALAGLGDRYGRCAPAQHSGTAWGRSSSRARPRRWRTQLRGASPCPVSTPPPSCS